MFINPKVAIEEGWITGIVNPDKQLQPNAIDFTLDKVHHVQDNFFIVSESGKVMRGTHLYEPILARDTKVAYWHFDKGRMYDGLSNAHVELPEGVVALLFTRSTFVRNGVFITSGLYDSGFNGHIGFTIHNYVGDSKVFKGTRIGQIAFVQSENALMYAGGYNHQAGTDAPHMDV